MGGKGRVEQLLGEGHRAALPLLAAQGGLWPVVLLPLVWVAAMAIGRTYEQRFLWVGAEEFRRVFFAATLMLAAVGTGAEPVTELRSVPLAGGQSVTVAVPPRAYLGRSTSLARFLDPGRSADAGDADATLSLVSAPHVPASPPGGPLRWVRAENGTGWRSDAAVAFPRQGMHAHLVVPTPSRLILLARGMLALVMVLGVATAAWALARTLCGEPLGVEPARWGWLFTFRGRLTGALFIFFLLPMAAFGATAYRALSREVERTAAALADRALTQAASESHGQPLGELARHVGADLLLYQDGVLSQAAAPEVIDLGLYHAWLPPTVFLDFAVGEATERVEDRELAGHEYLVAYRRFGARDVLASPTPLATGEIARRQRELADVVALAGLFGAALSVVLSLLVGRNLSRPIEALSGAAAAVGAGDLSVRLPGGRRDEFGRVYRSFNRMVRSLRQARSALVRETRRTEAIVSEAGTGVLALDAQGRVQLINPRAGQILGAEVPVGARIPEDRPLPAAVAATVRDFQASGARERVEERDVEGRMIRLRMRGLEMDGPRGAVLVIEDVTNEITSARVLAWGEMARQVGAVHTVAHLADRTGVPAPTVAKLMKAMTPAGLTTSQRGAAGGYALSRPADAISIAEIITALDGPIALTACVDGADSQCGVEQLCPMRGGWEKVNRAIRGALEEVTLADMMAPITFPAPAAATTSTAAQPARPAH